MQKIRLNKYISLLASVVLTGMFGVGCDRLAFIDPNAKHVKEVCFPVQYDYGGHVENKAVALLGGNSLFFDKEKYGISELLAGDEVSVYHTGTMLTLESYPGQVRIDGGTITDIKVDEAEIVELSYALVGCVEQWTAKDGGDVDEASLPQYVLVNAEGDYCDLGEVESGVTLYGTYQAYKKEESRTIYALYSYKPRE